MITGLGNFKDSVTESFTIYESKLPEFNPNASGTGVEGFVERLYTVALGRASEPAGKAYWVEKLLTKQMTGGAVAKKMLISSEFEGKKYTNEEFVEVLYRTFFNRTGEANGTKYWLDKLASGMTRENVIASFIDSNEWAGICSSYGISSGNSKNPPEVAPTDKTVAFVKRLYTCCLGRNGEIKGIADWSIALANKKYTGKEVAQKFFFSTEFKNKNLDNTEFVKRLYRTFFDREADTAGLNAWVKALNQGASREQVFMGFVNSVEWANLCCKYGIVSGGQASPNITPNAATINFVTRLYTLCLGRNPDAAGLDAWARALSNRQGTGAQVARGFFNSTEFLNKKYSNTNYVKILYRVFLGREADTNGLNSWVTALSKGSSRDSVLDGFAKSPEFVAMCDKAGIIPY